MTTEVGQARLRCGLLRMRFEIFYTLGGGGLLHRRSSPCPRCSRPGRRRSLLERLNQFHVGLFDRAERNVPSMRLVPGKLREIGAQRVILKIPASAGENFVANNDELIRGEALKLFGCQIDRKSVGRERV